MQDGVKGPEATATQALLYLAVMSRPVVRDILTFAWVQDGVEETEAEAIRWMDNIRDSRVATAVVSLSWVQDSIESVEVQAIEDISYMTVEMALAVVDLDWVRDGVERLDAQTIEEMSYLSNEDAEAGLRVIGMPFLTTLEPHDVSALMALREIADDYTEVFNSVFALRDGVTDDLAPVVSTLRGVAETNPRLVDTLLAPGQVTLERRTVDLPLSGDVTLVIIRTRPGATRSMDLLEQAVRNVEEVMDIPLPTNYVGLLYEAAVIGDNVGTNFGTHMAILPEFDVDDGSHEAEYVPGTIAHEVAHYYWSGNKGWVDEGAADFMASISENARLDRPVNITNLPCPHVTTIVDLEAKGDDGDLYRCNYSLGERLFLDLYRTLGEDQFWQGFRALHLASVGADGRGKEVGIEEVRESFSSESGAESVVIARWYDGTAPYDISRSGDGKLADPTLPSIKGRVDKAYVGIGTNATPSSIFSVKEANDWVYLTLEYSYDVTGKHQVPIEIVESYQDGFVFRRRTHTLDAEPEYIGGTRYFSVGSAPSDKWAPGDYAVTVYSYGLKIAQVEYTVTAGDVPMPEPTATSSLNQGQGALGMVQLAADLLSGSKATRFKIKGGYKDERCPYTFGVRGGPATLETSAGPRFLTVALTRFVERDLDVYVAWSRTDRKWLHWREKASGWEVVPNSQITDATHWWIWGSKLHETLNTLINDSITPQETDRSNGTVTLEVSLDGESAPSLWRNWKDKDFVTVDFTLVLDEQTYEIRGYEWRRENKAAAGRCRIYEEKPSR